MLYTALYIVEVELKLDDLLIDHLRTVHRRIVEHSTTGFRFYSEHNREGFSLPWSQQQHPVSMKPPIPMANRLTQLDLAAGAPSQTFALIG